MTRSRSASLRDVAKLADVSITTVSRVLNSSEHPVSADARERVLEAIKVLDYYPDAIARSLKNKRSGVVGVIVHDITDRYFGEIVRGIEDVASANGYLVLVCSCDRVSGKEMGYVRALRQSRADGIILAGGGLKDAAHQRELSTHVLSLLDQGHAVVALATQSTPVPRIHTDNVAVGRLTTSYLIGRGHREIATVAGPREIITSDERLEGYREALEAAGLEYDEQLIVHGDFTRESGSDCVDELLRRGVYFTAIFGANDEMSVGVLHALRRHGIKVPGDVSVIGVNDIPEARYTDPPLTTVSVPMRHMGTRAMETVLELIDPALSTTARARLVGLEETVPLALVERESVRSLAGLARQSTKARKPDWPT